MSGEKIWEIWLAWVIVNISRQRTRMSDFGSKVAPCHQIFGTLSRCCIVNYHPYEVCSVLYECGMSW